MTLPVQNNRVTLPSSPGAPAEAIVVQLELLMARDMDAQIRSLTERVRFMGKVRREYLKNISHINTFLAKNSNTSRKDQKRYIEASMGEMSKLLSNFVSFDANHPAHKLEPKPLVLSDNGDKQQAVQSEDDASTFGDWQSFFAEGAAITDPKEAVEHADKISDDDGELPFYFGHTNNTFSDGSPKIAVFVDGIEKFVEIIRNKMSEVQEMAETLSADLNRLTEQRKSALEGAHRILMQIDQTKSHALKGGA